MNDNGLLQVGDVFCATSLATKCHYRLDTDAPGGAIDRRTLIVGPDYSKYPTLCWTEYGEDGWERACQKKFDLNADDESRGRAEFLVTQAKMEGGGTGHGPHDIYPDGWHVTAIRLAVNGLYDPEGECVTFHQTGCFNDIISDVRIKRTVGDILRFAATEDTQ